eukprot:jgi/Undpi1/10393/HiC_scaffold_29.g12843.m1
MGTNATKAVAIASSSPSPSSPLPTPGLKNAARAKKRGEEDDFQGETEGPTTTSNVSSDGGGDSGLGSSWGSFSSVVGPDEATRNPLQEEGEEDDDDETVRRGIWFPPPFVPPSPPPAPPSEARGTPFLGADLAAAPPRPAPAYSYFDDDGLAVHGGAATASARRGGSARSQHRGRSGGEDGGRGSQGGGGGVGGGDGERREATVRELAARVGGFPQEWLEEAFGAVVRRQVERAVYDARARAAVKRAVRLLDGRVSWKQVALTEQELASLALDQDGRIPDGDQNKEVSVSGRYWKVGMAAAGGGVLLFLSGGVAAPSVTASLSAVGAVSGAAGAGVAGYKMTRRTAGVQEFHFLPLHSKWPLDAPESMFEGASEPGLPVFICIPGWHEPGHDPRHVWGGVGYASAATASEGTAGNPTDEVAGVATAAAVAATEVAAARLGTEAGRGGERGGGVGGGKEGGGEGREERLGGGGKRAGGARGEGGGGGGEGGGGGGGGEGGRGGEGGGGGGGGEEGRGGEGGGGVGEATAAMDAGMGRWYSGEGVEVSGAMSRWFSAARGTLPTVSGGDWTVSNGTCRGANSSRSSNTSGSGRSSRSSSRSSSSKGSTSNSSSCNSSRGSSCSSGSGRGCKGGGRGVRGGGGGGHRGGGSFGGRHGGGAAGGGTAAAVVAAAAAAAAGSNGEAGGFGEAEGGRKGAEMEGSWEALPSHAWWRDFVSGGEEHVLVWESGPLAELYAAMRNLAWKSASRRAVNEALKRSALAPVVAAAALPLALLEAASGLDDPWGVARNRASEAGRLLAAVLLSREAGSRPVTLLGFSMGAKVVFNCLEALAAAPGDRGLGIVENAVMLGTPVGTKRGRWKRARSAVAGRFINGFSSRDWLLALVYRTKSWSVGVAGTSRVEGCGVENLDLSGLVTWHLSYSRILPTVMAMLRLEE